jgi:hypothetical protein
LTPAAGGRSPAGARALGAAALGLALLAVFSDLRRARAATVARANEGPHAERAPRQLKNGARHRQPVVPAQVEARSEPAPRHRVSAAAYPRHVVPAQAGTHTEPALVHRTDKAADAARQGAARALHASAALLATSVLADSALEHYRGRFENPGMYAPLATSALAIAAGARAASGHTALARSGAYAAALAVGLAGTAFHAYNVTRRPGGLSWANLFYAAPLGAPAALALAGLLGQAAGRVQAGEPMLAGLPAGRALCALTGAGLAGTSAEAALLHFRGAYHHPAMWLPVTMPPLSAALLGAAALAPSRTGLRRAARAWLGLTALLGLAGTALHARGIARQMGGWRNWSQNLLAGPPLPAPPSFSALALAGAGALALLERETMEAA